MAKMHENYIAKNIETTLQTGAKFLFDTSILKNEEKAVFALRSIYSDFGYEPYKMAKFEEYDLYVKNKDFLVSDSVITFNDTSGKLLALKPDVTLSIIKNFNEKENKTLRVYYNESVYRVSETTHAYKEIMQTGLECMGDINTDRKQEVIGLAASSLSCISDNFVLEVSDLSILSALFDIAGKDGEFRDKVSFALSQKNAHEIEAVCSEFEVSKEVSDCLIALAGIYGSRDNVIEELRRICICPEMEKALIELDELSTELSKLENSDKIIFDFSIINNMKYYNGIVLRGYIEGIPEGVLAGGQYDSLMKRMGKQSGAIGFAVYLDLLENYDGEVKL